MKTIVNGRTQNVTYPLTVWLKRRKLFSELQRLDSRMLEDVGICRAEIDLLVEKSYPQMSMTSFIKSLMGLFKSAPKEHGDITKQGIAILPMSLMNGAFNIGGAANDQRRHAA